MAWKVPQEGGGGERSISYTAEKNLNEFRCLIQNSAMLFNINELMLSN